MVSKSLPSTSEDRSFAVGGESLSGRVCYETLVRDDASEQYFLY